MKSRSEQIRYALIARVLRRIELASVRQDHDAALKTYAILGKLDYLHYNTRRGSTAPRRIRTTGLPAGGSLGCAQFGIDAPQSQPVVHSHYRLSGRTS